MEPDDRRFSPRMSMPYAARLWAVDGDGRALKEDAVVDNLSTGGLYLRLTRAVPEGANVYVAVRLGDGPDERLPVLRLAAKGVVLRAESQPDGTCGVAVEFSRRRIL